METTSLVTTVIIIPPATETIVTAVAAAVVVGIDNGHVVGAVTGPAGMSLTRNKNNLGILICVKKSRIHIPQPGQIINQPSRKGVRIVFVLSRILMFKKKTYGE